MFSVNLYEIDSLRLQTYKLVKDIQDLRHAGVGQVYLCAKAAPGNTLNVWVAAEPTSNATYVVCRVLSQGLKAGTIAYFLIRDFEQAYLNK
jgi:hypothetical protein